MALTISQKPPVLLLADQPVVFKVTTNYTNPLRIIGRVTGEAGDSLVPDANHQVQFELSDYLKGRISGNLKTANSPEIYSSIPVTIGFTFEEYYNDQVQATASSTGHLLLDGKVPGRLRAALYDSYTSVLHFITSNKRCLTWWDPAIPKKVLPLQPEFLNFLQTHSITSVNLTLAVNLVLTDGSTVSGPSQTAINGVAFNKLVYFPTGYNQLGIPAHMAANHPGKTVQKYLVTVMSSGSVQPVSAVYNYAPDFKYYYKPRIFYVKNPFGMHEILLCTGLGAKSTEHKPEQASTDGINRADKLTWKNTRSDRMKVSTGYITADQAHWISDLLDTTEAFELIENLLYPIILSDSTLVPVRDSEYLFSAVLEYEYAYQEPVETV